MSQQRLCPTLRPCSGKRSSGANRTEIYQWMKSASSREDFPVSHSRAPGSDQARRMTAFSGRKCCALLRKPGPVSSLLRMCLESSAWSSTIVYLRWRPKATPAGRSLFQLVQSMPPTVGTESGLWRTPCERDHHPSGQRGREGRQVQVQLAHQVLWPTPKSEPSGPDYARANREGSGGDDLATVVARMLPTPQGSDWKGADLARVENRTGKRHAGDDLPSAVAKMIPTPQANDWKTGQDYSEAERGHTPQLRHLITGQLNPTWVEWLMGFPLGWTDLGLSETP
jgi:hypothetical protein